VASAVAAASAGSASAGASFAGVVLRAAAQVEIDGSWTRLTEGTALTTDPTWSTTKEVPDSLRGRSFSRLRAHQGSSSFKVLKDGTVYMACTNKFGRGDDGGDWRKELVTRADLEKQGWHEFATINLKQDSLKWIVFVRDCKAGETFTYRTEEYSAPFLIR
jgi:hypothetical protein